MRIFYIKFVHLNTTQLILIRKENLNLPKEDRDPIYNFSKQLIPSLAQVKNLFLEYLLENKNKSINQLRLNHM